MTGAVRHADAIGNKVTVLSSVDCPPIERTTVQVLFTRDGVVNQRAVIEQRPTYFDQLCTVIVEGMSSPPIWQPPPIRSVRDALRWLYRYALVADTKYGSPLRSNKPILDARFTDQNNVAHLLLEIIPLCLNARQCIGPDMSFAFGKLNPRSRELLSLFAIDPILTHKSIIGPVVHLRGTRGLTVFDLMDVFDCSMVSFLPNTYRHRDFKTTVKYDKVFIARRGARELRNHSDVERLLRAHGYTTVYMEDFSIIDQISIGTNAKHVVAIHGAAMAYLALNRAVDSIIELSPIYHWLYPAVLGAQVGRYISIIPEFDERIVHGGFDAILHLKSMPFEVNLALLERALAEIRCSANGREHRN
jgi:Glycosyltransferase 61